MSEEKRVIEAAGKDVEAAVAAGLARLGVARDAVDVEVLDEGRQGMFGLGARAARVRLTLTSSPTPKPPSVEPSPPPTVEPATPEEARDAATEEREEPEELTEEEDKVRVVRSVMEGLLDTMGLQKAEVDVERAEPGPSDEEVPPLVISVHGPGTNMLIGRNGEVLNALQHVTRLLVGRKTKSWIHLVVDVQDHKAKRAQMLRDLAHRMADQAASTDRTVILEPMPPHERRVIHVALYDDSRVTTESIYEGERRRVTIVPQ